MTKRGLLAVAAVFVTWAVLDFAIHGLLLRGIYERTQELWRPEDEMKMGLMYVVTLIAAFAFVYVYDQLITDKKLMTAVKYGVVFGLGVGVSMAYGTYSVMPIPYELALGWFVGTLVETGAAGLLVGAIIVTPAPSGAVAST